MAKVAREQKGKSLFFFPADYTVIDIETSGLYPSESEIIEVSALRVRAGNVVGSYSSLIRPVYGISRFVTELTGITNAMVKNARGAREVLGEYREFLGDDVLVGHNVNFDINFLYDNFLALFGEGLTNSYVDVLRLSRKIIPGIENHKQTTIAAHYGTDIEGAHRALRDCEICNANFVNLKADYEALIGR